ncbi:hypothetical protein [Endozoicomonas sp.]|uniref:hypothetical protein n=1 Tax=Endozoicomonas sp. TaxID=1892382 RepID=UPI0028878510|nr:hypothetical protein [Endozoicomonas sp.]
MPILFESVDISLLSEGTMTIKKLPIMILLGSSFFTLSVMSSSSARTSVYTIEDDHQTVAIKQSAFVAKPPVIRSNQDLIEHALKYGMLADAYQKSSRGMITEGYRYQLRQLYLTWLPKALETPGQTIELANESALQQWQELLDQAEYSDTRKTQWIEMLTGLLEEWSDKHQKQAFSLKNQETVLSAFNNKLGECSQHLNKPASSDLKQSACHSMGNITRQISDQDSSPETLNSAMKTTTYRYIENLEKVASLPYYKAYIKSRAAFNDILRDRLDTGYSYQQLSQILQLAGIDYPVIYQHIRELSLRHPGTWIQ